MKIERNIPNDMPLALLDQHGRLGVGRLRPR
jgi:hypothetical protein